MADASYQGVNLLIGGKLNVTFNEIRSHNMTVNGKDMRTDNIGLNMKNWNSKTDIETAIKQIVDAMNEVRSFSADLGNKYQVIQTRQSFTDALCDVLESNRTINDCLDFVSTKRECHCEEAPRGRRGNLN